MTNKTQKQIKRFIFAGICAVGTDCLSYYLLTFFLSVNLAKGISFVIGTIVAYLINKYFTFEQFEKSNLELLKFIVLYFITLSINILSNWVVISMGTRAGLAPEITKFLAFSIATGISAVLNFIGQKFFVFKT